MGTLEKLGSDRVLIGRVSKAVKAKFPMLLSTGPTTHS
jgi:hypothetical protein